MSTRAGARNLRWAGTVVLALWGATSSYAEGGGVEYRLGPGDVLQITVFGQTELSGKFRVGPEGAVSYPLIGAVPAANQTTSEVTAEIASRLSQRVPIRSAPVVEIAEFAPVFVTGEVERPGQYAFRPGMVALELIALAGGERRNGAGVEMRALQLLAAEQALTNRRLALFAARVQIARLEAEIAGQNFEPNVAALNRGAAVDGAEAERLVQKELDLFAVRRKLMDNQVNSFRDQRASYDREIATLRASIVLHDGEIGLLEQETGNAQRMRDRELGLLPTLLGLKRQLSATRRDALEIQSYLARAQQQQLEIDQKIQDLGDQQKRDNAIALRDLELSVAQTERGLQTDALAIAEIRSQLGRDQLQPTAVAFRVARVIDGAYADIAVDNFTRLAPRDILRATRSGSKTEQTVARNGRGEASAELLPPPPPPSRTDK